MLTSCCAQEFGPAECTTWLLVCGVALALACASQPFIETVSFDAESSTFLLTRRNGVGLRTEGVCHPLNSIARAAVSEKLVSTSAGRGRRGGPGGGAEFQKAQRLSVLLRSWAVNSYGDADGDGSEAAGGGGVGHAGLEIPLGMGQLLFDPVGVAKAAGRVQRFLCDHLPPGFGDEDAQTLRNEGAEEEGDGNRQAPGSERAAAAGLGPGGVLRPCCVCMFEAPNVVLLPCGHVNAQLCKAWARMLAARAAEGGCAR